MRRGETGHLLNPGTRRFLFLLFTYIYAKRCGNPSHCNILQKNTKQQNRWHESHISVMHESCFFPPMENHLGVEEVAARHCKTLQNAATHSNTPQHTETHRDTMHYNATHCTTLHHTVPHRVTLHCTATHCITMQHTVTRWAEEGNGNQ